MACHSVRRGPRRGADQTPFTATLGTATLIPVTDCRVPVPHQASGKCSWAPCSCSLPGQAVLCPRRATEAEPRRPASLRSTGGGGGVVTPAGTLTLARRRSVVSGLSWTPALCPSGSPSTPLLRGRQWAPALPRPVPTPSTCAPGAPSTLPPCVGGSGDRSLPAPPGGESHGAPRGEGSASSVGHQGVGRQEVCSRVTFTRCWVDGPPAPAEGGEAGFDLLLPSGRPAAVFELRKS